MTAGHQSDLTCGRVALLTESSASMSHACFVQTILGMDLINVSLSDGEVPMIPKSGQSWGRMVEVRGDKARGQANLGFADEYLLRSPSCLRATPP